MFLQMRLKLINIHNSVFYYVLLCRRVLKNRVKEVIVPPPEMGHPLEVKAQKKKESIHSIKNAIGLYLSHFFLLNEPHHEKTCFFAYAKQRHHLRHCFHYIDSTISLLPKSEIISLLPKSEISSL